MNIKTLYLSLERNISKISLIFALKEFDPLLWTHPTTRGHDLMSNHGPAVYARTIFIDFPYVHVYQYKALIPNCDPTLTF